MHLPKQRLTCQQPSYTCCCHRNKQRAPSLACLVGQVSVHTHLLSNAQGSVSHTCMNTLLETNASNIEHHEM